MFVKSGACVDYFGTGPFETGQALNRPISEFQQNFLIDEKVPDVV